MFLIFNYYPTEYLKVSYLDIGQGDSILLSVKDYNILIDGGPDNSLLYQLGESLLWFEKRIDYLIISHYHADHYTGFIELLNKYEIGEILVTNHQPDNKLYNIWLEKLKEYNYKVRVVEEGERFIIADNIYFDIILAHSNYEDYNDNSLVLKFNYYDLKLLFTGDLTSLLEKTILEKDLESQVLKVGHHGSKWSSSLEFLKVVKPEICLIQSGLYNKFQHPHLETINRLKEINCTIYNTQNTGTVNLFSNGYDYWFDF